MSNATIEVLFFPGCPNHRPAVDLVRETVRVLGLELRVHEVEIGTEADAERLRFLGSPSIRVNGQDIEPDARSRTEYAISCRVYGTSGVPPRDLLVAALEAGTEPAS